MSWQAEEIRASLEIALEEYAGEEATIDVRVEGPYPADVPGSRYLVRIRVGGAEVSAELSRALAGAYLADEESAVDEFKRWTRALLGRLPRRRAP